MDKRQYQALQKFPEVIRKEIVAFCDEGHQIPVPVLLYWKDVMESEGVDSLRLEWKCWKNCVKEAEKERL